MNLAHRSHSTHRRHFATTGLFLVTSLGVAHTGFAQASGAQRGGPPNVDTPRILVATFRSADRALGIQAGDALRRRLQDENSAKQLFVVPKSNIDTTLKQSGYTPDSTLSTGDLMELGKQLHAEEVVDGIATKAPDGVRIEVQLLIKRNMNILVQPLPAATGKNLGEAAKEVERLLTAARKSLPAYKACEADLRAQRWDAAITNGRLVIQMYPPSTLGRLCLLSAFSLSKGSPDSVNKYAEEILQVDPNSAIALGNAAEARKAKGDLDKYAEYGLRIYRLERSNTAVLETVIDALVNGGKAEAALPIVTELVKDNPDDARFLRKRWAVLLAAKHFADVAAAAEELAKVDTALAADFYQRTAAAATFAGQTDVALTWYARGTKRFPNDAGLHLEYAQALVKSGKSAEALDAARRAVALEPKIQAGEGQRYVLILHLQLKQFDSALVTARRAIDNGADKQKVADALLAVVAPAVKQAQESKTREAWQTALTTARTLDEILPTPATKFYVALSAFSIGLDAINAMQELNKQLRAAKPATQKDIKAKACIETKIAEEHWATASIAMPEGAKYNKEGAGQVMGAIQQYGAMLTQAKDGFCK